MSIDGWMGKENVVYPFSLKKKGNPVICYNMDKPGRHEDMRLSEISQS